MANTYKNIVITPNRDTDAANVPSIRFSGGDATSNTDINVRVYTTQSGTLSFEGSAGQLFSITNDLTNTIFSVNDVSGIPSLEIDAAGLIKLAEFGGNVAIGRSNASHKLDIVGTANASNILVNGNMVFTTANDGAGSNLDADLLDGQQGSYYGIATDVIAAFAKANAAPNISNSYTVVVGAASNGWANIVGTSGNSYATAVGISGNSYATAVGISGNSYATAVGTSGNTYAAAYAVSVGTSGNTYATAYAVSVGTAGNSYATAVGTSGNSYATAVGTYANLTFVKLTAASQTITGNLNIVGDLTLSGNTFVIDATRLEIDDPLIYLAGNNYASDIVDIGFIANYVNATGSNVHTGLYREHVDKMYYLFQGYDKEPENNHLGALSNNMTLAVLNADLRTSNLVLGGANAILTINGAFNKANAALSNTSGSTFNGDLNVSGNLTSQTLSTRSNVINFGTTMSILPNGMIMIYGDINMLT